MSLGLPLARSLAPRPHALRACCALAVALLGHGLVLVLAAQSERAPPRLVPVTEVELMAPAATPPAPPPALPPPTPESAPEAPASALRPRHTRAEPRASVPARAAAIRTIEPAAAPAEEPVRFASDERGGAFGYGQVASGGSGDGRSAAPPAGPAAPAAPDSGSSAQTPALGRPPRLGEHDPCRGFFPARAGVDRGEVTLRVRVDRDGSVRSIVIERESPLGHGFGFAARDCLHSKRFVPALDTRGREVAVLAPITVRFSR